MQGPSGGGSNVIRFPGVDRRDQTDIELVHAGAPSRSMVEGFLDEAGMSSRDVVSGLAAEIAFIMGCFEQGYGNEATVLRYREMSECETSRAAGLIRQLQATADALVLLERSSSQRDRLGMHDRARLGIMRERFRGQAVAARAAANAAIAASVAMTAFVREGSTTPCVANEPRQLMLFAAG